MNKRLKLFLCLSTITAWFCLLPSCTRDIDIDLPEPEKKIVVNGVLTAGELPVMFVSRNAGLHGDSFIQAITTAKVVLIEENGWTDTLTSYYDSLQFGTAYYGSSGKHVQEGKKYNLIVEATGYKTVYSTTTVPQAFSFSANNLVRNKTTSDVNSELIYYDEFNLQFTDNVAATDYYLLTIDATDTLLYIDENGDTVSQVVDPYSACFRTTDVLLSQSTDIDFGGSSVFSCSNRVLINDKLLNGKSINALIQILTEKHSNEISTKRSYKVYLSKVTESYYNYVTTFDLYLQTGNNPFSEPVQVFSNIENGLGIFAAKKEQFQELK